MPFVGFQATHRGHRICCASKNVTSDSINDFWHSDYIKNVRSKMLKGEYVKECTSCYQSEEQGQISLRNHYNNRYKDFSENNLPTALDLDFSNLCNLKCIMCGPDRSSMWAKEKNLFK